MAAVKVVLADDHPVFRAGLRSELGEGFWVVGEASDAAGAIETVRRSQPDLLVCDLHMPGGGIAVVRACSQSTHVVILSVSEEERPLLDAVGAGAVGWLLKTTPADELRASLGRAARGEPVFPPHLAMLLLGEFRRMARSATGQNPLSAREREVLGLVARGQTYRQIGEELFISTKTVETHVRHILDKLHLRRREELTRYAVDHGVE